MRKALVAAACLALALPIDAAPAPTRSQKPSLDFSGTWDLDERASINVSANMKGAVLIVEQRGDEIRISPGPQAAGQINLAADVLVVDGRPYEKNIGGGKGVATARWSADGQAMELTITAPATEGHTQAVQTSRWTLSKDGSTWVRETRTVVDEKGASSRLIFRRRAAQPASTPSPKPAKK
jgi:hypothetical protein